MEAIILDKEFNELSIVDDYISFIWATRYYTCGDFELCVDVNQKNRELLIKDFYVMREDDENVGIIEDIEISVDDDEHEMMIVKGRFLSSILSRRIIEKQTQINDTVSNGVYKLIDENVINPTITARKIDNFIVENTNFTDMLIAQYTGKNLLETIESVSETYGLGFKTVLNNQNQMIFSLYKGIDRSYEQDENEPVVFSDDFDNLISSKYTESTRNIVTDVLVAGEGEGLDRKTLWVSRESKSGLDRYEVYQDQRNASTNDGEITDEEYYKQLNEEGLESISTITTAFEGTVYFDNIKYKEDVFCGDICVIENTKWGIYINSRLIEVIESVDEDGVYSINPKWGV